MSRLSPIGALTLFSDALESRYTDSCGDHLLVFVLKVGIEACSNQIWHVDVLRDIGPAALDEALALLLS